MQMHVDDRLRLRGDFGQHVAPVQRQSLAIHIRENNVAVAAHKRNIRRRAGKRGRDYLVSAFQPQQVVSKLQR